MHTYKPSTAKIPFVCFCANSCFLQLQRLVWIIRRRLYGQQPGEHPAETEPIHHFEGYSSHDAWGTDHFAFTYRGDLRAFCAEPKRKGVRMAVEPWEFKPGMVLCYVAAPDGVSIELIQVGISDEEGK